MSENYMDRFKTPEEFITNEILANRGTQNAMHKFELIHLIESRAEQSAEDYPDLNKLDKSELLQLALTMVSYAELEVIARIGVSSHSFQMKFDITHDEVKRMARLGLISVTGSHRFRMYGKYNYADTYSVYDYFRLTPATVHGWLTAHPKGTRKPK